ncbi:outer membrane protein assembly factor BamD [Saezia sanguinis]|uniref:outer membrane protein assembly factor BamD n=1 Tax=Saezia sanguinis TaxID=1965230 RepID=UPI001EF507EB|nr:outer membrane protein assembly factor BamD [Saezia sanguinis]
MKNFSCRLSYGISITALALLLSACSSTKDQDETAGWTPNKLYSEAQSAMISRDYDKAIEYLNKLEGRAAGTMLAQQAQLEAAYAMYKNGDKEDAVTALDRFMQLHPSSPAYDYALYLKALVNFNDDLGFFGSISNQDLSERDQQAAKASFQTFSELVTRFPDSKYAADARQRMVYIVNALAQSDVHIARYYYTRGAYVAAANRAQEAIQSYQQAPALEEALYILYMSYDKLGMPQLRDDAKRVLDHNFPDSSFLTQGFRGSKPWWQLW